LKFTLAQIIAKDGTTKSDLVSGFAIAFLGLTCIWEGVLKTYLHYNSIGADSEPLDYFIAGLLIVIGSSLLISLKGLGGRPSYSFPLLGTIFGAFKIYTDIRDPGDILLSIVLISGSLILLASSFRLERKYVTVAIAESWLTIIVWIVAMVTPATFLWDFTFVHLGDTVPWSCTLDKGRKSEAFFR
jgi:hypothetical protein